MTREPFDPYRDAPLHANYSMDVGPKELVERKATALTLILGDQDWPTLFALGGEITGVTVRRSGNRIWIFKDYGAKKRKTKKRRT